MLQNFNKQKPGSMSHWPDADNAMQTMSTDYLSERERHYLEQMRNYDIIDTCKFARMFQVNQCFKIKRTLHYKADLEIGETSKPIVATTVCIRILGLTMHDFDAGYCSFQDRYQTVHIQYVELSEQGVQIASKPPHSLWLYMQSDDLFDGDCKIVGESIAWLAECTAMSLEDFCKLQESTMQSMQKHIEQAANTDTITMFGQACLDNLCKPSDALSMLCFKQDAHLRDALQNILQQPAKFKTLQELRQEHHLQK